MRAMLLLVGACAKGGGDTAGAALDPTQDGPYAPGRRTVLLDDADRPLEVELWYPAEEAATPIAAGSRTGAHAADYADLLAAAPAGCPRAEARAAEDAPIAAGGPFPLIALSHCYGCLRSSMAAVAERLASHGFVVAAPDHVGNTLWESIAGESLPLDTDTLRLRADDIERVLDAGLSAGPVGVMGHSFGAVTAGLVLQERLGSVESGLFIGAPVDNPLLPGVEASGLDAPTLFMTLMEDHSIGTLGNTLIASNVEEVPGPVWSVWMADAGHWSPSDLVGLVPDFLPGCGEDHRAEGGEPFTYLDPATGRDLTSAVAVAFFAATLRGEAAGADWLAGADGALTVTAR